MDSTDEDPRPGRRGAFIALGITAVLVGLIGIGLWRITAWLEPGPIELPPEGLRAQPGLQRFLPSSDRRLLSKLTPTPDSEEPPVVPGDHPFAKTRVTGRVYDIQTQEGIANAEIRVSPSFGRPKLGDPSGSGAVVVRSRADGSYAIKGLPPGAFDLDIAAAGYLPVETGIQKYSAIEDDDGFDVGMVVARAIEGVVLSAAGAPVAGAEVFPMFVGALRIAVAPVMTDTSGHFLLDAVETGAQEVMAIHPGHGAAIAELAPSDQPSSIVLRFEKTDPCEVRVSGPNGPIEGASVRPLAWKLPGDRSWVEAVPGRQDGGPRGPSGAMKSGPDGRAQVTLGVDGGGFSVEATGFAPTRMGLERGATCSAEVRLRPAIAFEGRVLSAAGAPVEKATVGIDAMGDRGAVTALATTDGSGHFRFTDISDLGPFEVHILHYEHPMFTTTEGSLVGERTYYLEAAGRILAKLVDAKRGGPITQYEYSIFGPVSRRGSAVSVSGAFEVGALPAGRYGVRVQAEGYGPGTAEITVAPESAGPEVTILMEPSGTIVGSVEGPVPPGLEVGAIPAGPEGAEPEGATGARVGDDGRFSINVPAGQYRLILFGHDGDSLISGEVAQVLVRSGEVTGGVRIVPRREPSPDAVE